jgi:hypothetical protein
MFRRLAETFKDTNSSNPHSDYINQQQIYLNSLPDIIPTSSSGIKNFDKAIESANTLGTNYQNPAVQYPNSIFMNVPSRDLSTLAQECSNSSIDALISSKNPAETLGCGWLYTPPPPNSPYPILSQGFLGKDDGPVKSFPTPEYKKWFFDLQLAKKQILLDKCKALKACTDIDQEVFKNMCGYCTNTNQGVPIDNVGKPLYDGEMIGNCDPQAIVRSADKCPPPPPPAPGPQPYVDRTCDPVNGRLSADCLRRQVLSSGCDSNGALAIALASSPSPNDYIGSIRESNAIKIYNRLANPPLNLEIFKQGRTTITDVLKEVRQLKGNTKQPENTGVGAASRDLCLRRGAIQSYDICSELSDSVTAPFDLQCLQKIFLEMGGHPNGLKYPTNQNIAFYNNMVNIGAVRQYIRQLFSNMYVNTPSGPLKENFTNSSSANNYNIQRQAMIDFLGIVPEKMLDRAPYSQGIEVFWFVPIPGNPRGVRGFLRRTIERDFVQLQAGPSRVAQIGGGAYGCMLQLTDIRAPNDFSVRFKVLIDDGFWISVNQPADIDKTAMNQVNADSPGLFENLGLQGPTWYQSSQCSDFTASKPNIVKMFFEDAGGGWNAFQMIPIPCSGNSGFQTPYYSLTCEENAPFLTYEVNSKNSMFEELRNPGLFGQFLGLRGLEYHTRTDEKMAVPGNKSFIRLNNSASLIDMYNIAFQSWKTVTFAIRLQSMPIKETLVKFAVGRYYLSIIATPINTSTSSISIESNFPGNISGQSTPFQLIVSKWYLLYVQNTGSEFKIFCNGFDELINNRGRSTSVTVTARTKLYSQNGTWSPAPGQPLEACTIMLGSNGFLGIPHWPGMYATPSFNYDLAWIHFFQQSTSDNDILREASCNWIYTIFPSSYNTYKALSN